MVKKIQKWGNSQGLRLDKQSLRELVSRIPRNCKTRELDWGKPRGKEVW